MVRECPDRWRKWFWMFAHMQGRWRKCRFCSILFENGVGVWGAMAGCHDWVSTVLSGESGVYVALISKSLGRDLLWFFEASEELRWSEFSIRIPKYQFQTQKNPTVFSHETQDVEEVTTFVDSAGTPSWIRCFETRWKGGLDALKPSLNDRGQKPSALRDNAEGFAGWNGTHQDGSSAKVMEILTIFFSET